MEQKRKIAILYDFDKTLSTNDMECFGLFDYLEIEANDFFSRVSKKAKSCEMDRILAFMLTLKERAEEVNKPLTHEIFVEKGKDIEFYSGVESWFKRINQFGKDHDFEVEHYLISSGLTDLVEGCKIFNEFKRIYACKFIFDDNGNILWPARAINYTNKTQFIFRINKGILDVADDSINNVMQKELRPIPYENIIYIGDGYTDIPCMKVVKGKGGMSIAVYAESKDTGFALYKDNRVTACCKADYSEGSELDITIKNFILTLEAKLNK